MIRVAELTIAIAPPADRLLISQTARMRAAGAQRTRLVRLESRRMRDHGPSACLYLPGCIVAPTPHPPSRSPGAGVPPPHGDFGDHDGGGVRGDGGFDGHARASRHTVTVCRYASAAGPYSRYAQHQLFRIDSDRRDGRLR